MTLHARGLLLFAAWAVAGLSAVAAIAQQADLPEGPGKAQVLASCTRCHGVDVIIAQRRTGDEWQEVMSVMIGHGAQMTDADYEAIAAYLATNLGPAAPARPPQPEAR